MKRLLFILVCLCTYAIAFAQNITVSGTVTASDGGDALIGVTVKSVKGKEAAVTDFDGRYTIKTQVGQKLIFSYIGYREYTVTVKGALLNVVMQPDNSNLDEVVVVATDKLSALP